MDSAKFLATKCASLAKEDREMLSPSSFALLSMVSNENFPIDLVASCIIRCKSVRIGILGVVFVGNGLRSLASNALTSTGESDWTTTGPTEGSPILLAVVIDC